MERKNDVNKIKLTIDEVRTFWDKKGIVIDWSSTIGFGQYLLRFHDDGTITGDSENMDSQEDKDFLRKLLELLADKVQVK